jgi:protein SCO1
MAPGEGVSGFALWLLASLGAGTGAALGLPAIAGTGQPTDVGESFALTAPDGRTVSGATLQGKPFVLVFGTTRCGEDCTARLTRFAEWHSALGARGADLRIVFVSVDHGYDTPERMGAYIRSVPGPVLALTGAREPVAAAARTYGASLLTAPLCGGGYAVLPSRAAFLVDEAGRRQATIAPGEAGDVALAKLRRLVAG